MNPSPSLQGALWNGNQQLATKKQLISSIEGLYDDLKDFNFSTISVSTLTVPQWISTPLLYVSDIQGYRVDVSGISATTANFNLVNVSSLGFTAPSVDSLVKVNVDFNLGDFVQGALIGTGALLFETAVGIGIGAGATFIGIGNGIASLINSKDPVNNPTYINTTNYEVMGGSTQLQVSTLGNAYPAYSSIMRYVSSISPNQVPGVPMFASTIFYPGQICIRSISDPYPLVTGDTATQGSTIQQFGEWVPLEGLEPENIIANSISTNNLSTGNLFASLAEVDSVQGYSGIFSNAGFAQSASLAYNAPLQFQTGATNQAAFQGYLNRLYCYNNTGYIFNGGGGATEMGSLYLGTNANESLMNISSIYSLGQIKTVDFYASTITAEQLNVVSTLFLTSTSFENITSTNILNVDTLLANEASIANFISSFSFTTKLGNPISPFDINKNDYVVSTTYNSVSSLTQNILNYSLVEKIQEETVFPAWSPTATIYTVSPANVNQWASTMLYCNPGADIGGQLAITYPSSFFTIGLTGTFDLTVDMTTQPFSFGSVQYINQSPGGGQNELTPYTPPTTGFYQTYRFTTDNTGIWSYVTPAPAPYETTNSNVFKMYQDINDTYISATDRLHIEAGDILLEGTLNLANTNINTLNATTLNASNVNTTYLSEFIQTNNTFGSGSQPPNMIELDYSASLGYVSSLASTPTQILNYYQAGFINNYVSQISTTAIRPILSYALGSGNTMTLLPYGDIAINGTKQANSNWAYGTIVFDAGTGLGISLQNFGIPTTTQPILNLSNAGSTTANLAIAGRPATTIPPFSGLTIIWNGGGYNAPIPYTAWNPPLFAITDDFQINQSYGNVEFDTANALFTGNLTATSNLVVGGASQLNGQITTYVPSAGFAGIELTSQNETTIVWSFVSGSGALWESSSQNLIPRAAGGYYKSSDWDCILSVQEWTTPDTSSQQNSWSAKPVLQVVGGITYYAIYRYLALIHVGPPASGTFVVNVMMIPKNLTT